MFGLNGNTSLLLPFDGLDAATSTVDSTGRHSTINFRGTAQLDTAQKKWGTAALLLDGNSDWLDSPDSDDWDIAGGSIYDNITIDFFIRPVNGASYGHICLAQWEDANNYWRIKYEDLPDFITLTYYGKKNGSTIPVCQSSFLANTLNDSNWHHIAFIRKFYVSGGNNYFKLGLYVDGAQVAYAGLESGLNTFSSILYIGYIPDGNSNYFSGHIDELRIHRTNYFNADPNSSKTNTIVVPTAAYSRFKNNYGIIMS